MLQQPDQDWPAQMILQHPGRAEASYDDPALELAETAGGQRDLRRRVRMACGRLSRRVRGPAAAFMTSRLLARRSTSGPEMSSHIDTTAHLCPADRMALLLVVLHYMRDVAG